MEQENIIRSSAEIDALLAASKAAGDELLEHVLRSQQDFVVDLQKIEEPAPELGSAVEDLPVDEAIINIQYFYKFFCI